MIADLIRYGRTLYEHDKLSRDEIKKYSEKKFRRILKYAYKNSAFYKRYYNSNGIKYDELDNIPIDKIPAIDKKIVRNNFYDILTKPVKDEDVIKAVQSGELLPKAGNKYVVHTSGSTGTPTNFIYDKRALMILEANFARLSIHGENPIGMKDFPIKSLYIAPVGSGYACTALAIFGMEKYHCRSVIVNAQTPLNEWKKNIQGYKPCYLSGYPSCINLTAQLKQKGEIDISPKKIITGGEPLNKEAAQYYKKVFNADVIDYYGCTESIFIGAGTNYYDGMYIYDDLNYVDVDANSRLIITPLYNKILPLIKYKLSDVVEGFTKDGYGNLPYTHIDKILGRAEELMWFVNEKGKMDFLHPLFLDDLDVKGITKYQFVQKSMNYFELRCVSLGYENQKKQQDMINNQLSIFLKNKKLENVKYDIKFVDNIEADKSTGKTKIVLKNF